jgi:1-acyl-sn-glycerol-3-phosphate acyltransferase
MFIFHQIKAILVGLVLIVFVLFPVVALVSPFSLRRRLKILCPVWAFCSTMLLRHAAQAKILVREDHRSEEFKVVPAYGLYVANHQSYADIPLVFSMYQVPPIMKKEVLFIPLFGWIAWASGGMPVSRSSIGSRKKVFSMARNRICDMRLGVQVYPEGTRSKNALPREFDDIKKTLLIFAYNKKIPVIPTSIYGTRGIITQHGFIKASRKIGIIVHKEIHPKDYSSAEDFCRQCWGKVKQGHDQIKNRVTLLDEN